MNLKIKELRIDANLTQKELAKKLNTSDKNIWAYENAVASPPIEILKNYALFFNVSIDFLLGLEDDFGVRTVTPNSPTTELTAKEKALLDGFRKLVPETQDFILNLINTSKKINVI